MLDGQTIPSELSAPPSSTPMMDISPENMASMLASPAGFTGQDSSTSDILKNCEARKQELHSYLRNWLASSMMHRRANYEDRWNRWRRNARSIYDPSRKARKEKWQNSFFVPITMQNKEIIKSQLYRTLISGLPYSIRPRPSGNLDEAQSLKILMMREMERGQLEIAANDCFDDLTTYGTMFLKTYYKIQVARRSQRQPIYAPMGLYDLQLMQATGQPPQPIGYKKLPATPTVVYKGLTYEYVSIWDMFFGSNAKSLSDPHAQRYKMSLQEIIDGVQQGWAFPESVPRLRDVVEPASPPPDLQTQRAEREPSAIATPRQVNEREHTVYEWWGVLPKRLMYLRPEEYYMIDNPEELVPAKCLFANECLVAVDANEDYKGETPYLTTGYLHVPGSIYHIGVSEMLEQIQDSINEDTNQRKDNVQLILNRMFAILEKAIVSRSDLVSRPGGAIRIKSNSTDDVQKAVSWIDTPDVTQSSYIETQNAERFGQELTGANRVTVGSGGSDARDVTQTKGGMQMLAQSANDRFTYYAMLIEADFTTKVIRKTYTQIYQHADPQDLSKVLGERAMFFQLRTPEDVENDYFFSPEGVFTTMHQPIRIQQWQAYRDQYAGAPFFNDLEMAQILGSAIELPEMDKVIVPMRDPVTGQQIPFQMMQSLALHAQMMMQGAPNPPAGPGKAGAPSTVPRMATQKPGSRAPDAEHGSAAGRPQTANNDHGANLPRYGR